MLIGISKIPKIPILLLNGHTNSSSWSEDPNWNYEVSAYIRIPSISAPNKKNSTYPSQAGAIGIILIMRTIFSFRYHKDTAFRMSNVSFVKKNHCDMCSHLATLNPLTFSIPKKSVGLLILLPILIR